jgi:hypothetical protein
MGTATLTVLVRDPLVQTGVLAGVGAVITRIPSRTGIVAPPPKHRGASPSRGIYRAPRGA